MRCANEDGFTLVEMLITIAVVGVVFGLLSSVIAFGRKVQDHASLQAVQVGEIELGRRLLTDILSQIASIEGTGLAGARDGFRVSAFSPHGLGSNRPVETRVSAGDDGRGLDLTWSNTNSGGPITRRIVANTSEVTFSYFATGRGWLQRWSAADPLPRLVRIDIKQDPQRTATAIIVPVLALARPECLGQSIGHCEAIP